MKQEIEWQEPTKENLAIDNIDSKDILLLKCHSIVGGKRIVHILMAKYDTYSIANQTRIWFRLSLKGYWKALPGDLKVASFAIIERGRNEIAGFYEALEKN